MKNTVSNEKSRVKTESQHCVSITDDDDDDGSTVPSILSGQEARSLGLNTLGTT